MGQLRVLVNVSFTALRKIGQIAAPTSPGLQTQALLKTGGRRPYFNSRINFK